MDPNHVMRTTATTPSSSTTPADCGSVNQQFLSNHSVGTPLVGDGETPMVTSLPHDALHGTGRRTSRVWKYFSMVDNCHYVCCLCNFVGAYTNTTNMRKHIQNHHPEIFQDILDHTRPSNRLHFLRTFPPQLFQNNPTSPSPQYPQNFVNSGGQSVVHLGAQNNQNGNAYTLGNSAPGGLTQPYINQPTPAGVEDGADLSHFALPPPSMALCRDPYKATGKSPTPQLKSIKVPVKTEFKSDGFGQNVGDERKLNAASTAGGSVAPGLDESSAGSGEGATCCDEVSVPLSPEQFLSEDMDRGTTPGTPSSQRPESYKLRHNNHLTLVLESLAGDESFMDVTLTAQGRAIKAHKSVLSAVSPYFRSVLKQNPCQHPIIIMPRDVRFEELSSIISYVYKGEMTVAAEDLSSLLKTAEVLQVTGLSPSETSGGPGGIMSQMQGLPSGVFPSTSASSSSSSSKTSPKKAPKEVTQPQVATTEEVSQGSAASVASESHGKLDPLEFLNADMTCVKEEIQSEDEETEDSNFGLSLDTTENSTNPPDTGEASSNRCGPISSPNRSAEDPTGKPFNPGEAAETTELESTSEPSSSITPYVCPYCLETHRPNEALHTHLRLKHPSKPSFICTCAKVFMRQSAYVEHSKKCTFQ